MIKYHVCFYDTEEVYMFLDNFNNLDSKEVFRWFSEMSQIPRESGHEKEISDFLVKFAKDRNLESLSGQRK